MTNFTEREKELIDYMVQGYDNRQIGEKMFTTIHTVKAHMTSVMRKLGVHNRTAATYKILQEKLKELENKNKSNLIYHPVIPEGTNSANTVS